MKTLWGSGLWERGCGRGCGKGAVEGAVEAHMTQEATWLSIDEPSRYSAGSLAAIMFCAKRAPRKDLSEMLENSTVSKIDSRTQLEALFSTGGKTVVYLTADW